VISCHRSRGGKLGVEQCAGGFLHDRQPTGQSAIGELGLFDGVDLPYLVDSGCTRRRLAPRIPETFRRIDAGGSEGPLEGPGRGEICQVLARLASELDTDNLSTPVGMGRLQCASPLRDPRGGRRPAAVPIARVQAIMTALPEGSPDLPGGVIGQGHLKSDL
jgi:hypothetical protein